MFHDRRSGEKWADDTAPLKESGGFTKVDSMVFERVPVIHQNVTFRRFDALVDLVAHESFGCGYVFADPVMDCLVEFGLFTWMDQDID